MTLSIVEGSRSKTAERRAKNRSFDLAQDNLSGGVLRRYVGATLLRAGKIPRPINCRIQKRLLEAGCWHMSLFQQPTRGRDPSPVARVLLENSLHG